MPNVEVLCRMGKAHQCQWFLFASLPSASPTHLLPLCRFLHAAAAGQATDLLTGLLVETANNTLPPASLQPCNISILLPASSLCENQWVEAPVSYLGSYAHRQQAWSEQLLCKQEGWQKGALGGINALALSPPSPKGLIYVSLWQWLESRARLPEHNTGNRRAFAKLHSGTGHICRLWEKRRKASRICSRPSLKADQRGRGWMQGFLPQSSLLQADLWSRETHVQHSKATLDRHPYWVHSSSEVWFGLILSPLLLFSAPEIPTEPLLEFSTLSHSLMIPSSPYCF